MEILEITNHFLYNLPSSHLRTFDLFHPGRGRIRMMTPRDKALLDQFAQRVRTRYPEAQIWAFGSRARGDAAWDSDFDLCVVLGDDRQAFAEPIGQIAWDLGFENGLVLMFLAYRESEFFHGPRRASLLARNILQEGVAA
jgi:uncharacterized protein